MQRRRYRRHRSLSREVAAYAGRRPHECAEPGNRENVTKAAVLLRVARALNLGKTQAVAHTAVSARSGSVLVKLTPRGKASVDLELWAIERGRDYFRGGFWGDSRPPRC